ncbi:MAG TPA: hypothetical protein VH643_27445 [Gemmataceae bacterium]|jgi:hypothetical protein
MSAERYSQEQILCGLRIVWREELDFDPSFDLDTRIDENTGLATLGDLIGCLVGEVEYITRIAWTIETFFGFSCRPEEWNCYFGLNATSREEWEHFFAPCFTFRRLVEFIQARVKPLPLEPITVLGKPCLTAGIFRGLERLARQVHPALRQIAPSTPICARLHGLCLRRFWNRLRWITEERIPTRRIKLGCGGFYFKLGIGLAIALWKRDLEGLCLSLLVTALLFIPTALLLGFLNSRINPMPKEIKTFGDLARYLAVITGDQQPEGA